MGAKLRLTERDLELLGFVAEHRIVLAAHVKALLGISAWAGDARLRSLTRAGYLVAQVVFHRQPPCFQITRSGLGAIESRYSKPRFSHDLYAHDVGVAWLWLAARAGVWGPIRELVSERQMRSADGPHRRGAGLPPERVHYPDLLIVTANGRRVAFELELTSKSRSRREKIIAGYAVDRRIDAVVYLVENRSTGRSVEAAARRFGIGHLVHVQQVRWGAAGKPGRGARTAERSRDGAPLASIARPGGARRAAGR